MKINLKEIRIGWNSSYDSDYPKIAFRLPIKYTLKMRKRFLNEFPFKRFLKLSISRNDQHSKNIIEKFKMGYKLNFKKAAVWRYNNYSSDCGMEIPFEKQL